MMELIEFRANTEILGVKRDVHFTPDAGGFLWIKGLDAKGAVAVLEALASPFVEKSKPEEKKTEVKAAPKPKLQSVPEETKKKEYCGHTEEKSGRRLACAKEPAHVGGHDLSRDPVEDDLPAWAGGKGEPEKKADVSVHTEAKSDEVPEAIIKAAKLRDVLSYLIEHGHNSIDALVAECEKLQTAKVCPVLDRIVNLNERVVRAAELLGVGASNGANA